MTRSPAVDQTVREVPEVVVRALRTTSPTDPISVAIERLLSRPESRMVYVVESDARLVGTVSWRNVLKVTKARFGARSGGMLSLFELFRDLKPERVEDVMRAPTPVTLDTPLREVLVLMDETQQNDLPVVDEEGRLIGEVNGMHIMRLAFAVFQQTEADLARARIEGQPGGR